jgi:glycosyltransferase involved in cell wall biosynthesis
MPSRGWEAFPLVALESFAAGAPVVATRVPGLEDLVEDGRTGWLVPPESAEQLAEVLRRACGAERMSERQRAGVSAFAGRYSWGAVARAHVDLYERLLGERTMSRSA